MSPRTATWLALALWAACVALIALGVILFLIANRSDSNASSPYLLNNSTAALSFSTVGAILASQRRKNPIGWIFCSSGLLFGITLFADAYVIYASTISPGLLPGASSARWITYWLYIPAVSLISFVFLLFPDGRLPSPRWRPVAWLVAIAIVLGPVTEALEPRSLFDEAEIRNLPPVANPFGVQDTWILHAIGVVETPLFILSVLAPVVALFVRLRRSEGEKRQQIKWVAYAGTMLAIAVAVVAAWPALDGSRISNALFLIGFLAIPAAIAVAILKYRLYDIDVVINRTLVYGALTASLALVYFGGVAATQAIFHALTGQQEQPQLAIVVSTLIIAALFSPLRRRIQSFIDRRFYRSKYDARKTLEALSARLRDETDLGALSDDLVRAVRETMQPAHISLWLQPDPALKHKKKRATIRESGRDEQ